MLTKDEKRWVLYDFANSAFAVSVISGFFPILFRQYWAQDLKSETITLYLGTTNSLISFFLFLTLPYLGYLFDFKSKSQARWLFQTACLGGLLTATLFFAPQGSYYLVLFLYFLACLMFSFGNTQCDGLLYKVSQNKNTEHLNKLSSWGYLMGYIGGGLALFLQSLVVIFHKWFGFDSALYPALLAFLTTGLWWIGFSSPLLKMSLSPSKQNGQKKTFALESLDFVKKLDKRSLLFLAAFFLYIDVVYTTYKMAVDFGLSLGLSQNELIGVLLYVQIIAAPGTYFLLYLSKRFSLKLALFVGLFCYGLVLALSPLTQTIGMFLFLATFIGLAQGGIQSLSRSYFSSLLSEQQQGLGFGFFNVFGKLSAILGPLMVGATAYLTKSHTFSVLSLLPFLVLGAYLLHLSFQVKEG